MVAPSSSTKLALSMLERVCEPDPEFPFGTISSIYYDTRNWDYLSQKRNSDYLKLKIRLRWYSDVSANVSDSTWAEAKFRIGSRRRKVRVPTEYSISRISESELQDPILNNIPKILIAKGVPVEKELFPAFVVQYQRHRFIDRHTKTRICIDHTITSPKTNPYMLKTPFPCRLNQSVVEVKGTNTLFPRSLDGLLKLGFRVSAFSKYYQCYSKLTNTFF